MLHCPPTRVVEASVYLQHFCSDRSHMYDASTGTWNAPPPTYDCIQATGQTESSNIQKYIAMTTPRSEKSRDELIKDTRDHFGVVMTVAMLQRCF